MSFRVPYGQNQRSTCETEVKRKNSKNYFLTIFLKIFLRFFAEGDFFYYSLNNYGLETIM